MPLPPPPPPACRALLSVSVSPLPLLVVPFAALLYNFAVVVLHFSFCLLLLPLLLPLPLPPLAVQFSYTWSLNHRIGMFTYLKFSVFCVLLLLVFLFCVFCCVFCILFCCSVKMCNLFCFYCCRFAVASLQLPLLLPAFHCTHTHDRLPRGRRTHTQAQPLVALADARRTFSFRLELEFIWVFLVGLSRQDVSISHTHT